MSDSTATMTDQSGRALGPRAVRTRQRLIQATGEVIREKSVRDASVTDIARRADTSPATFYQYFKDVPDAVLELSLQVAEFLPRALAGFSNDWRGPEGLESARQLGHAFLAFTDEHRPVLLARNLLADEGDLRFMRARRDALGSLMAGLAKAVVEGQQEGRIDSALNPMATAAAIAAVFERLATYSSELGLLGVPREAIVETCARLMLQILVPRDDATS